MYTFVNVNVNFKNVSQNYESIDKGHLNGPMFLLF